MFKESNSLNNDVEKESKTERNIEEMEQELVDLCARYDNPIAFYRHGSKVPEGIPPLRNFAGETGDEKYKELLSTLEESFIEYLHSPIFTDSFHQDHASRRRWQDQSGGGSVKEMLESDLYEYYKSNCLNANYWLLVSVLQQFYKDPDFQYPKELIDGLDRVFAESVQDIPKTEDYNQFTDEEKIACIPKIESVMKKILAEITIESKN
jgi:hypothetical protein